ncbi:MAG: OmpA family protein [Helicobacteraceae bacterium]|jgi:peptidoglycan-associated lipoprotein|nr:OmpA family protein [Helicobacteraceae bacterium]
MKIIVLSSALIAMLAMTGCTTKEAPVEEPVAKAAPVAAAPAPVAEVVVVKEIVVEVEKPTLAELEGQLRTVNFAFDKYKVDFEMEPRVIANSNLVNGDAADYMIKLEGNCDTWGSNEYNFALGLRRANAVKSAMVAEGVDSERISMVSYGENNPVCSEATKECWSQNRRVDVKLLP